MDQSTQVIIDFKNWLDQLTRHKKSDPESHEIYKIVLEDDFDE